MLQILYAYGIPKNIIQTIALTNKDTFAKVTSHDGDTELFEIKKGVLQGDTLAPFLFIITLDYAMQQVIDGHKEEFGFEVTKRQSRHKPATYLIDLSYSSIDANKYRKRSRENWSTYKREESRNNIN